MNDELRLPPRRELPPEIKARMRATVTSGLAQRRPRGRILAAAAAVIVFAVGAVVITQLHRPHHDTQTAVAPSPDVFARCWAGVVRSGKTGVPDVSTWAEVAIAHDGDDTVVAFTAAGKPMFCETTATTVTLSDPNATPRYAAGTHTALLLTTGTGLVAGIADPDWPGVELEMPDGLGIAAVDTAGPSRQFTAFTQTDPATTRFWTRRYVQRQNLPPQRAELPPAPAPLFSMVDRPADNSTPAGHVLTACLDNVPQPPADRDAYTAGALLADGQNQVVLARAPGHTIVCVAQPIPGNPSTLSYHLYRDNFIGDSIPVRRFSVPALGSKVPFIGIVPSSGTSMTADFGPAGLSNVPIVNGTFATWLPAGAQPVDPTKGETWVKVLDSSGTPLFNGYVPLK